MGPMLLSFRVANHRSFRDEQLLLLTPQYPADHSEERWETVPVAGIFGPNAAGTYPNRRRKTVFHRAYGDFSYGESTP